MPTGSVKDQYVCKPCWHWRRQGQWSPWGQTANQLPFKHQDYSKTQESTFAPSVFNHLQLLAKNLVTKILTQRKFRKTAMKHSAHLQPLKILPKNLEAQSPASAPKTRRPATLPWAVPAAPLAASAPALLPRHLPRRLSRRRRALFGGEEMCKQPPPEWTQQRPSSCSWPTGGHRGPENFGPNHWRDAIRDLWGMCL